MASTRERAAAVMAAVERRDANLDDVGLNWSCWIDKCHILPDEGDGGDGGDGGGSKEEDSVDLSRGSNTMTLSKEDMNIYGYCPALDNFYLVVCSHCGQLVKPQAFEAHCERRHAHTKLYTTSSGFMEQQCPQPRRLSSIPSSREGHKTGEPQEAAGTSKTAFAPQHKTTKVLTEDASSLSIKTSGPREAPPSSTCPSPSHPWAPPRDHVPLAPPVSSHSSASPSEKQKRAQGPSRAPQSPSTYSRTHRKVHKKECDLDEHCSVLDPARKTLCTRQLMCNIHSVHQRGKVAGWSKPFHQLEMQQRSDSSGSHVENLSSSKDSSTPMAYLQMPQDPIKRTLGTNSSMLWCLEEQGDGAMELDVQPPYPFNQSLPSSGDSEEEEQEGAKEDEEKEGNGDIPATPWHPKPLGICTFGSHTLGCSIFTFDRRLHHLRFALSDMVEQHVNAHLWKRIPPVPAVLQSCHPATTAQEAAIKSRASFSHPSSSGSPSSESSRPRRNQQTLPSSKPPSTVGPYPTRIPFGQPGKAPLKVREPVPMMTVVPHPARPIQSCSSRAEASMRIRKFPLHEKDQRQHPLAVPLHSTIMSAHRPVNRHHFPTGAKASDRGSPSPSNGWRRSAFALPPHQPPQPSNLRHGRAVGTGPNGVQQKPGGRDFRGPAQKRKMGGSELSASHHATLTRSSSKPHHPPSQSPSGLFSWRKAASVGTSSGE